ARGERGAGDEGPGAVRCDDALARLQAVLRVGIASDPAPVLDIAFRQRNVERRAARAAGGVDARGLRDVDRRVRAERRMLGLALSELVLFGERQLGDGFKATDRVGRIEAGGAQLLAIEGRMRKQPLDLPAVRDRHKSLNIPHLRVYASRAGVFFSSRRLIRPSMPCCLTMASNSER